MWQRMLILEKIVICLLALPSCCVGQQVVSATTAFMSHLMCFYTGCVFLSMMSLPREDYSRDRAIPDVIEFKAMGIIDFSQRQVVIQIGRAHV